MMQYPRKWKEILCDDLCIIDGRLYCPFTDRNGICEVSVNRNLVSILGFFPDVDMGGQNMSLCCIECCGKVFFCPMSSAYVGVYDIKKEHLEFIKIPNPQNDLTGRYDERKKFYDLTAVGNKIFLQPITYPGVIEIDAQTYKIKIIDEWVLQIEGKAARKTSLTTRGSVFFNEILYLPLGGVSGLISIDVNNGRTDFLEVNFGLNGLYGITQVGKYGFVTEHDANSRRIVCIDFESLKQKEINIPVADQFLPPVYYKEQLYFFPNKNDRSFRYDYITDIWEETTSIFEEIGRISVAKTNENEIFIVSQNRGIYSWEFGGRLKKVEVLIEDEKYLIDSRTQYNKAIIERAKLNPIREGEFGLRDFIGGIINA